MPETIGALQKVFPACAGVILLRFGDEIGRGSFPRMRGGDPTS